MTGTHDFTKCALYATWCRFAQVVEQRLQMANPSQQSSTHQGGHTQAAACSPRSSAPSAAHQAQQSARGHNPLAEKARTAPFTAAPATMGTQQPPNPALHGCTSGDAVKHVPAQQPARAAEEARDQAAVHGALMPDAVRKSDYGSASVEMTSTPRASGDVASSAASPAGGAKAHGAVPQHMQDALAAVMAAAGDTPLPHMHQTGGTCGVLSRAAVAPEQLSGAYGTADTDESCASGAAEPPAVLGHREPSVPSGASAAHCLPPAAAAQRTLQITAVGPPAPSNAASSRSACGETGSQRSEKSRSDSLVGALVVLSCTGEHAPPNIASGARAACNPEPHDGPAVQTKLSDTGAVDAVVDLIIASLPVVQCANRVDGYSSAGEARVLSTTAGAQQTDQGVEEGELGASQQRTRLRSTRSAQALSESRTPCPSDGLLCPDVLLPAQHAHNARLEACAREMAETPVCIGSPTPTPSAGGCNSAATGDGSQRTPLIHSDVSEAPTDADNIHQSEAHTIQMDTCTALVIASAASHTARLPDNAQAVDIAHELECIAADARAAEALQWHPAGVDIGLERRLLDVHTRGCLADGALPPVACVALL